MIPKFEDCDDVKKTSKKVQRGTYHNFTKEELAREGITPIDKNGKLLRCREERSFCFYDHSLLDYEVNGQITVLRRCHQCGTIYYYSTPKTKDKPILRDAIGFSAEPRKPSNLEIRAEEETGKQF